MRKYTREEIQAAGLTRDGLRSLGVTVWPPPKGWVDRLMRGEDPNVVDESVPTALYERLNASEWGARVRIDRGPLYPGLSIEVSRKDGTVNMSTVKAILWVGTAYALCSLTN